MKPSPFRWFAIDYSVLEFEFEYKKVIKQYSNYRDSNGVGWK
jgi:hypothetical protein